MLLIVLLILLDQCIILYVGLTFYFRAELHLNYNFISSLWPVNNSEQKCSHSNKVNLNNSPHLMYEAIAVFIVLLIVKPIFISKGSHTLWQNDKHYKLIRWPFSWLKKAAYGCWLGFICCFLLLIVVSCKRLGTVFQITVMYSNVSNLTYSGALTLKVLCAWFFALNDCCQ